VCVQVGTPSADKATIWVICRQHPGEPMAEWFAEGLLERLTGAAAAAPAAAAAVDAAAEGGGGGGADPEVQQLLERAVLYIVPNMNPDGSIRWGLVGEAGNRPGRMYGSHAPVAAPADTTEHHRQQYENGKAPRLALAGKQVVTFFVRSGAVADPHSS